MASCMNYNKFMHGKKAKASGPTSATDEDKKLGYPSFQAIAELKPDYFYRHRRYRLLRQRATWSRS